MNYENQQVPNDDGCDPNLRFSSDTTRYEYIWQNGQHDCRNQTKFYILQNIFSIIAAAVALKMNYVSAYKKKQTYSNNAEDPDRRHLCSIN